MSFEAIAIFILATAIGTLADDQECAGGIGAGATVERGRYWYECRDGQLIPKGCLTEDHRRINLGDTFDSNSAYRMQCTQDRDGYLTFTFKSCIYNGREYQPNERWDDVKYSYTCTQEGDHLRVDVAGCIDQGRRVDINVKVHKGSFVYQCLKTKNGTCSMCPVGCTKDNREYGLGDTFERSDYWYTCTRDPDNGRKIAIKPGGCVNNGRRIRDGETFQKQDVVYECYAKEGEVKSSPVGCVQNSNEHRTGDTWIEGQSPFRYEMACVDRDSGTKSIQKRCNYDVTQGQTYIEPGCYKVIEHSAIGCLKLDSDRLEIRAFRMDDIDQAGSLGLRFC